ncbi:hypothetical protein C8R44DRAFT_871665 [Mycena epipterygia]|nr:hypothetical protein C8R44DRAFT_871665 [Mycena epipterygia]
MRSIRRINSEALLGETLLFVHSARRGLCIPSPAQSHQWHHSNREQRAPRRVHLRRHTTLLLTRRTRATAARLRVHLASAHAAPVRGSRPTGCGCGPAAVHIFLSMLLLRLGPPTHLARFLFGIRADEARRQRARKIARMVRMLQENVPTELVSPVSSTPTTGAPTPVRTRTSKGALGGGAQSSAVRPPPPPRTGACTRTREIGSETTRSLRTPPRVHILRSPAGSGCACRSLLCADSRLLLCQNHLRAEVHALICAAVKRARMVYATSFYSSSPPVPTAPPTKYDCGTPVRGVSYAIFPSSTRLLLLPIVLFPFCFPVRRTAGVRCANGISRRARCNGLAGGIFHGLTVHRRAIISHPVLISAHPRTRGTRPRIPTRTIRPRRGGHDRAPPPSSNSHPASSPNTEAVGYDRGTHRTEKGSPGEWVTGVHGSGKGLRSMDDVARRLRGLRLR